MTNAWTLHLDNDWIAWLTFDRRGEKVNAFTASVMAELDEQLDVGV